MKTVECVCLCLVEREKEREGEEGKKRGREREWEKEGDVRERLFSGRQWTSHIGHISCKVLFRSMSRHL